MQRLALLTCIISALCAPALAQDDAAKVRELIGKLGNDKWEVREKAQREIVGIGEPARKQLIDTLEDADLEIRSRASSALIAIGETFAHAVECALATTEGRKDHGKLALQSLFRIDDAKNLRVLGANELQNYGYNGDRTVFQVSAPPPLAIARVEAASGMRLLVSPGAAESWQRLMSQAGTSLSFSGDMQQVMMARNALIALTRGGGSGRGTQLGFVPMRVGRHTFFYVTEGPETGQDLARRAGEHMINTLLTDGPASVRAAALLAEGASTDSAAVDRIRAEYVGSPQSLRLMWLVLALGPDEAATKAVRTTDPAPVLALLESTDWTALSVAGRYFECLENDRRSELLGEFISASRATLPMTCALWWARGLNLDAHARARVLALLDCGQDALAAAAARWLAGAAEVSDAELEQVWAITEKRGSTTALFEAALELFQRPEIAARVEDKARTALGSQMAGSAHLAAVVLKGRATPADLALALSKLEGNDAELGSRVAALFTGCNELDAAAQAKFVTGLCHERDDVRARFRAAFRVCGPDLKRAILVLWASDIAAAFERDATRVARKDIMARVSLWAFQAAAGDGKAFELLMQDATGEDLEKAKWAGASIPDALDEKTLVKEMDALKNRPNTPHAQVVVNEAYLEMCRRAVAAGDKPMFRKYQGMFGNLPYNLMYMVRNELQQLQARLARLPDAEAKAEPMPRNLALEKPELT